MTTRKNTGTVEVSNETLDVSTNGNSIVLTPESSTPAPIQEVTKIGNLVKDPQLRYTTKGTALCEVDLAVNPKPGEDKETEFYRLLIFGPIGENVSESEMGQSTRVIVVGTPDIEEWTDNEGVKKIRKKIFVTAIGPDLRYAIIPSINRIHRSNPKPAVKLDNF